MLADRDRVFTNLYGEHDWHLAGARKRGEKPAVGSVKGRQGSMAEGGKTTLKDLNFSGDPNARG